MDFIKKYITEATIASIFILFCYIIQISFQSGQFTSYGLYNATSYIRLDVQNIIITIGAILGLVLISIIAIAISAGAIRKIKKVRGPIIGRILTFCIFFVMLGIYTGPLNNAFILRFAGTFVGLLLSSALVIAYLSIVSLFLTLSSYKKRSKDDLSTKFFKKVSKKIGSDSLIIMYMLTILIIVLTPVYGYYLGYSIPRSQHVFETVMLENQKYILADLNKDNALLVKLKGNELLPEYIYMNRNDSSMLRTKTEYLYANFDKLGSNDEFEMIYRRITDGK